MPMRAGMGTSMRRPTCRRRRSTAWSRFIATRSRARGRNGEVAADLHALLSKSYAGEAFVHVLPLGEMPHTRHVRGSNMTFIGVAPDRIAGRVIVGSALDNLVKGASGQAVQNMNLL